MSYSILRRVDEKKIPTWERTCEKWHAIFVRSGEEDRVKERLLYKFGQDGPRIIVPKRKLKERKQGKWEIKVRVLFPGYVLLNGHIGVEEYYLMKNTPGIIDILRDKSGLLVIQEDEIRVIKSLICDSEIISTSRVYMDGSRVIVVDGPLLGMEGLIESIDKRKGRVKVKINFIGQPRTVELSVSMVQQV